MTGPFDELSAPADAAGDPGADNPGVGQGRRPSDPVGVAAIVCGCVGLVVGGFVLAIVTMFLGAVAGGRARDERRPMDNAYIAFVLGALDGVVFIVLHFRFNLPAWAG